MIRNASRFAPAAASGDSRFTRKAGSAAVGSRLAIRPIRMNSGLPGGCGTPRMYEVAMNSPQSQNETVGATVSK